MSSLVFTARAALALALLVGFYVLAVAIAAGLLWMPYAEVAYAHRISLQLIVVCVGGAFAILRGSFFIPRPPFRLPGPELRAEDQPELFAVIREIAAKMEAPMPKHVYLVPDVNAFVTETGGFLGFGATRILGVGLGLLHVEDVSGLRATLAHEFGHYSGGHTRLGGVVYRTRAAIGQVLRSLGRSWVSKPFQWYASLYLLLTNSVSRSQELEADRSSVAVAGREAHLESLRSGSRGNVLFGAFVTSELRSLLEEKVCPKDIYAGFKAFAATVDSAKVDAAIAERKPDRYDTHPPFAERVAFARGLPDPGISRDTTPAFSLLKKPDAVESALEPFLLNELGVTSGLSRYAWTDLAAKHYGPRLAEEARRVAERLYPALQAGPRYADVAQALLAKMASGSPGPLAEAVEPRLTSVPAAARDEVTRRILGRALGVLAGAALVEKGAAWAAPIGAPLTMSREGESFDPLGVGMAAAEKGATNAYRDLIVKASSQA